MSAEDRNTQRGLPTRQTPRAAYFVTCRLVGTLPTSVTSRLRAEQEKWLRRFALRGINPLERLPRAHKLLFARFDDRLDRAQHASWLAHRSIASLVRDSLLRHQGIKYRLLAYCVMPSHFHALLRPFDHFLSPERDLPVLGEQRDAHSPLARILRAWKAPTTYKANQCLGRSGPFWHPESFLQLVSDDEELERLVDYITYNPVKAGLIGEAHDWPWCSAHDRFQNDGSETGWLPLES